MKSILKAALVAGLVALAGCSTLIERERPTEVQLGRVTLDPTPLVETLLRFQGTKIQAVEGAWKNNDFQAQCVMKGDGAKLTVVFLAPQVRLVTITVTAPHAVRCERVRQIPRAFNPEYALVDLAIVNLSMDELAKALAPTLKVVEKPGVRQVLASDGGVVAEVTVNGDGTRRFRNLVHGYEYRIKGI